MLHVDVILPCYNPIENWTAEILNSVEEIKRLSPHLQIHIILVNDGSSTGVQPSDIKNLEENLEQFTYINYPKNEGKGNALRVGVACSKKNICIYTDVDFPYTVESFIQLLGALQKPNVEVAVGHRDEAYYNNVPSSRKRISKVFRFFIGKFFRLKVVDTQCGLKGFKPKGRALFLETTTSRYLFDLEFIQLVSTQMPEELIAVPVTLKPGIVFTSMNLPILLQEGYSFLAIFFRNILRKKKNKSN